MGLHAVLQGQLCFFFPFFLVTVVGTSVQTQIIKLSSQFGLFAILMHLLAGGQ
jgi:hypothetical protein